MAKKKKKKQAAVKKKKQAVPKRKKKKQAPAKKKKQAVESKQTPYEDMAQKYFQYREYEAISRGGNVKKLNEITHQAIAEGNLYEEDRNKALANLERDPYNLNILYEAFQPAFGRKIEAFQSTADNLEGILNSAPEEVLAKALSMIDPDPEKTSYTNVAQLHKEYQDMLKVLGAVDQKHPGRAEAEQVMDAIKSQVAHHYQEKYEGKEEALSLLLPFIKYSKNDSFVVPVYQELTVKKAEEFKDAFDSDKGGYIASYFKSDDKEGILNFYANLLENGRG